MAVLHGLNHALYTGGTPTTFTSEACTVDGTSAQITAATKRVWDPATAVVVAGNTGSATAIDFLTGTVTFSEDQTGQTITVSGKYVPLLAIAKVTNLEISRMGPEELDTSAAGEPCGSAMPGMVGLECSFDVIDDMRTDFDAGAGIVTLESILAAGEAVLLDACPGGGTKHARAWGLLSGKTKADAKGLVASSMTFKAITRTALTLSTKVTYSWA